jgi:hypothetical protein
MTHHSSTDRFAIVPITHGAAPDDAIVVGPLTKVFEYIPQSVARADAVAELKRARFTADQMASLQSKTRAVQATMLADSIAHLSTRLDAIVGRRADAARARAEAEEEAEAKHIQAKLDALPDPDDPDPFSISKEPEPSPELKDADQSEFPDPDDPTGPTGTVFPQLDKKV